MKTMIQVEKELLKADKLLSYRAKCRFNCGWAFACGNIVTIDALFAVGCDTFSVLNSFDCY